MKITDITRELFATPPYPGDPAPALQKIRSLDRDGYRLTALSCCLHNGTHLDAPSHFLRDGGGTESVSLSVLIGPCEVSSEVRPAERLLLKRSEIGAEEARTLIRAGCRLIGVEGASVGSDEVHRLLLEAGVAVLENLELSAAEEGAAFLVALPLKLAGAEAAPVRAVLISGCQTPENMV